MTDRELLEKAARAAGLDAYWDQPRGADYGCIRVRDEGSKLGWVWSPLSDDGDAFRLAVKLEFNVLPGVVQDIDGRITVEKEDDPYAATRRAIVRAAAAMADAPQS